MTEADRCWGIYRESAHSPGRVDDDRGILESVGLAMQARGFTVELLAAEQAEVEEKPDDPRYSIKKTIVCAHKIYDDETGERRRMLGEKFDGFNIVETSIIDDNSLDNFKKEIFRALSVIRVYTKHIGEEVDYRDPIILPLGGTVEMAAEVIHKDFARKLKFAKVWGEGKFDGQRVHGDCVLNDGDIIEFHI